MINAILWTLTICLIAVIVTSTVTTIKHNLNKHKEEYK